MNKFMIISLVFFSMSLLISCDDDKDYYDDPPPIVSVESDLEFGDIGVNIPVTLTLNITNNLNDNLTGFTAIITDSASGTFSISPKQHADKCGTILYANMTCTLRVTALSTVASTYDGDLIISTAGYSKEIDLEANVMQGATLNIRTSRLYGRTAIGVGRTFIDAYSVIIENNGTDNLTEPLKINLTGSGAAAYSVTDISDGCTDKILAKSGEPTSSCLIAYTVTPKFAGWNEAIISATSGTVSDSTRLGINGTYGASVAVLSSVLDFGNVEKGVEGGATLPLAIFNTGYVQIYNFNWDTDSSSSLFFVEYTLNSSNLDCTNVLGTDPKTGSNCSLFINFTNDGTELGKHKATLNLTILDRVYTIGLMANAIETPPLPEP